MNQKQRRERPSRGQIFCLALGRSLLALLGCSGQTVAAQDASAYQQWRLPPSPPHPANNKPNTARVELGRLLFFDSRLSGDHSISCASCHVPALAWSDGRPVSIGIGGQAMARNSQSLINVGYYPGPLMWAGQKPDLESQVTGPMLNPEIMATDLVGLAKYLDDSPGYARRFAQAYPGEAMGLATIGKALAAFQRSIISRNSPFDQWLAGRATAMTAQQKRGLLVFTRADKGNCASCHRPPNFSDNGFYNIGLPSSDPGRYSMQALPILQGAFKTPQLRDIEHKAPYMHDGSLASLADVIEHCSRGGGVPGVGKLSEGIAPLQITQADKGDLLAFLKALSGPVLELPPRSLP